MDFLINAIDYAVKQLRANTSVIVDILVKYLRLSGLKGWIASFFFKKAVKEALKQAENATDKAQGRRAIEKLKNEMSKPKDQVDRDLVDRLEKEILEGK